MKCPRNWERPKFCNQLILNDVSGIDPDLNGALGGTRTPDTLVRSQVLYPAELRAQKIPGIKMMLGGNMVGRVRFELTTKRLKVFCSTD